MSAFTDYIEDRIEKHTLPGVICGVFEGDKEKFFYKAGWRDMEEKLEIDENTIFRLASMTKPVTAVAALMLMDKGLMRPEDPVSRYLPYWKVQDVASVVGEALVRQGRAAREITLMDIFTHSSGLGSGSTGSWQLAREDRNASLQEMAKKYAGFALDFEPGTRELYSGVVALDVVAAIIENLSGVPYEQFIRKNIFEPLGMQDTFYTLPAEKADRVAKMYAYKGKNRPMEPVDMGNRGFNSMPAGYPSGCAGLFSTYHDYLLFAKMLSRGGALNGRRLLSEQAVQWMGTRHFAHWGIAVYVRGARAEKQPLPEGSFGWSGAYSTHFWVNTDTETCALFMTNLADAGGSGAETGRVFEEAYLSL